MIVIGDVHGCYKTLMSLISKLPDSSELCFLGDLIDRGPDSKKVVEFVKSGDHKCVLGNHEDMALQAVDSTNDYAMSNWIMNGGDKALNSYGGVIDEDHLEWFASLPYKIEHDKFVMSHSNAAAAIKSHDAKTYTIWNRDFDVFLTDGRVNIFGHTPVNSPQIHKAFIMLDTGCVFGKILSAYDTETGTVYQQDNIERDQLKENHNG